MTVLGEICQNNGGRYNSVFGTPQAGDAWAPGHLVFTSRGEMVVSALFRTNRYSSERYPSSTGAGKNLLHQLTEQSRKRYIQ
jgi:hypothetical protein